MMATSNQHVLATSKMLNQIIFNCVIMAAIKNNN